MAKLFDLNRGVCLGEIGPEELVCLRAGLGGPGRTGEEYRLDRGSLEALKSGGDPASGRLHELLAPALGTDGGILVLGVGEEDLSKPFKIRGRVLEGGLPCGCCKVEAFDEHPVAEARLGAAFTGLDGAFSLSVDDRDFRGEAALLLVVSRWKDGGYAELLRLAPRGLSGKRLDLGDVDAAE